MSLVTWPSPPSPSPNTAPAPFRAFGEPKTVPARCSVGNWRRKGSRSGGATVLDGQQLARLVGRHGWALHQSSQLRSPRDELDVVLHRLPLGEVQVVLHADPQAVSYT